MRYLVFPNIRWMAAMVMLTGYLLTLFPGEASAIPAFARQKAKPCSSCHFQHFPALNEFGREFRAEGYLMFDEDETSLLEEDDLSLPLVLNMAVIAKLRYEKTNGDSDEWSDYGEIQWPDEAALMVGGRLAEHAGFLMELGLLDANSFLSTKLHFNVTKVGDTRLSIVPFSTDGLGVAYGFELLNTGAQRSQRAIEAAEAYSAAQALGLGHSEATGVALVASNARFFVNYTPWVPGWSDNNTSVTAKGLAHYFRAALTPVFGLWDTGFGVQYWTGDATVAANDGTGDVNEIETDGWIVDAQVQTLLGEDSMPLGLYASYGSCRSSPRHFAEACRHEEKDATAWGMLVQFGFLPNIANAYLAHRTMDIGTNKGAGFHTWVVGMNYMYTPNIRFELFYEKESGSGVNARTTGEDTRILFQLFAGF